MVSETIQTYLKHKKYMVIDFILLATIVLSVLVIWESSVEISIMEIKQPFRVGQVKNGKFVEQREFCLGDIVAYELLYDKKSGEHGEVTDTVQDTFMYFYPPHPTMIPVGKGSTVKFLQTSKYWIVGNGYRIIKTAKFEDVGLLNRTKIHTFKSLPFSMVDCGRK